MPAQHGTLATRINGIPCLIRYAFYPGLPFRRLASAEILDVMDEHERSAPWIKMSHTDTLRIEEEIIHANTL